MDDTNTRATAAALAAHLGRLRRALEMHVLLVEGLVPVALDHPSVSGHRDETKVVDDTTATVLGPMLHALASSGTTIVHLSEAPGLQTRDCFAIARCVVELAVNVCFLLAEGEAMVNQALRHAEQRAFRDLQRTSTIGNRSITATYAEVPLAVASERVAAFLKEFTSAKGREKPWTDRTLDQRIERAGKVLGEVVLTCLHNARFMVYAHSSEILHGTYFGVLYFLGLTLPSFPRTQEQLKDELANHQARVLSAAISAMAGVLEGFHASYGAARLVVESRRIVENLARHKA
jgi:hypothetical protein